MSGDIFDGIMKRKRLTQQFFDEEEGGGIEITEELEVVSAGLLKNQKDGIGKLRRLREEDPEAAFLVAHHMFGEDVTDVDLQTELLDTMRQGLRRAEPGEQLGQRMRIFATVTGRRRTGYTWARKEDLLGIAEEVLSQDTGRVRIQDLDWRSKIQSDTGIEEPETNRDRGRRR